MPKELTNNRPKAYSQWHRKLPEFCYQTDGDFFEQRIRKGRLRVVAIIETICLNNVDKYINYPIWDSKMALYKELKEKVQVPVYIVYHNKECSKFMVIVLGEGKPVKMNEEEYSIFIKGL